MKVAYVLPQSDREQIEKLQKQIEEIKQSYMEEYLRFPFKRDSLEKRFRGDRRIQVLEKAIANIYIMSVGSYAITTETEDELRDLKERLQQLA